MFIVRFTLQEPDISIHQCTKSVCIQSFSGPYSHALGLNTEIYVVNLEIINTDQKSFEYGHCLHSLVTTFFPEF